MFSQKMSNSFPILFIFLALHVYVTFSDPRISLAELYCGKNKAPSLSGFIVTFIHEMGSLLSSIANHHFTTRFTNSSAVPLYGLAQCHDDLSPTDCLLCFAASRTKIPRCLPSISARIYLDGCFLRHDNYSFYHETLDPVLDKVICNSTSEIDEDDETGKNEFGDKVGQVIKNVTEKAVLNGGFGIGEVKGVYALAQCWGSVSDEGCRTCLENASNGVKGCAPSKEGRGLNAGCYLRYSTEKFYNDGQVNKNNGVVDAGLLVAIVLFAAAFLMLSSFAAYAAYTRSLKTKRAAGKFKLTSISINSGLHFKYETLEKATGYFGPSRKIGQGGSGSVFKGILPDGSIIAVKRLVFNTRQWVDDFFNEVNLISGMQHKNLVKLLGCSIEGPESLLVYEYVPNRSLDQFIFDKTDAQVLNWKQRMDIISGTAEGIAHLHGGSQTRIIHRDIKCSNILLDDNLNPKIADFGLVRCFGADKSHLSTGIAGTLGYLAPEYLVRGQLTDKADVYSFGLLVLEIVCGRRNNSFAQDSCSLLQIVWKMYKLNRLSECVDPCLANNFPEQEAIDVLQIGLLCAQASIHSRPSMAEVLCMLRNENCDIPMPNQPPFLNARLLDNPPSSGSYSVNSFVSTVPARYETVYSSSNSSSEHSPAEPSQLNEARFPHTV